MNEPNNARMFCLGHYTAIYDYEVVDTKQEIWKGTPFKQLGMREKDFQPIIYFSRSKNPDDNELEKVFPELEIRNESIMGVPFLLVCKEKLLFGHEPGSAIIATPNIKFVPRGGM